MPDWATAAIALGAAETGAAEPFGRLERGRVLARSALQDAGSGGGRLWFLDRDAWQEARRAPAATAGRLRTVRVWDALVQTGAAAAVDGWYLSMALDQGPAALDFDDPAVAGAIRRMLASYVPLLAGRFIATSTLMSDWRHCAGSLTVFEARSQAEARTLASDDPWGALFPARLFRLERAIVRRVAPPAGPNTQRYGGANPWPGGAFG